MAFRKPVRCSSSVDRLVVSFFSEWINTRIYSHLQRILESNFVTVTVDQSVCSIFLE